MTTPSPKTALVIGATGLIGNLLTHRLVDSSFYSNVKVLVRKSLNWQHPRLQEVIFDFDHPNGLLTQADDVFCCLGTTIKKAGSKDAFRKVDYQYPLDIARLSLASGASQFAIVTALGAKADSSIFYNRVKGEVERDLTALNFPTLLIFRPSLLLGDRSESRLGERIGAGVMRLFGPLIPSKYKGIDASKVANAMLETTQQGLTGKHVFESDDLQKF
ncbi:MULTISPECIES: oxidoreductase [unclassified Spirosoma]|uniref:oxidoreductase n=1 Tax=unclassified Spirosoma TaxID=2621999 RepID=UPI000966348E|nr:MULTISPECIES: oxidoreductase [unclassified Spirosoma]MBN8821995.1 oxidoreductase [Spirosoma sp.]OJW80408.1 MAG: oxidoreductase [Spirosoma sp. 48-14]